jgi:serine/threonine protein phosphatase PrpC
MVEVIRTTYDCTTVQGREEQWSAVAHVFALTDPGVVRTDNEDSIVVARAAMGEIFPAGQELDLDLTEGPILLAVSDGMGGANAGEVASALTIETLRDFFMRDLGGATHPGILLPAIEEANAAVFAAAQAKRERSGMGATLIAALIHTERAEIALVGDSRAYVLRHRRLFRLTRDQTYLQALLDSGALTPEQAKSCAHRSIILQSIGTKEVTTPALNELPVRRGDRLLLCSDGLTNELSETEIEAILATHAEPSTAAKALIDGAKTRGGRDNVSAIVAFLGGEDVPPPSQQSLPPAPPPNSPS